MSLPEERAARNEALFREVNEQVRSLARAHPLPHKEELVIICECSDEHCMERISLRVALYEAVRTNSRHFIVVLGHDNDFERVLDSTDTYAIVEKEGRAGRIAERADPRG